MDPSQQKIVQYLDEAHATEVALVRVLQSQIAMTPRGSYRTGLEKHLRETRDHARRVKKRRGELGAGRNPVQALTGAAEALVGQALALAKTPLDIVRGTGGEEKVLKNARDASATEALEIATYTSIEQLARAVGDEDTAKLAASIRADEEKMLALVLAEIPKLTAAVVGAETDGDGAYDITRTGAADAVRAAAGSTRRTASSRSGTGSRSQSGGGSRSRSGGGGSASRSGSGSGGSRSRSGSGSGSRSGSGSGGSRSRSGGGSPSGSGSGSGSGSRSRSASNLPIARYDDLSADEVVSRLSGLSESDRSKVRTYERSHKKRATVLRAAERSPAEG